MTIAMIWRPVVEDLVFVESDPVGFGTTSRDRCESLVEKSHIIGQVDEVEYDTLIGWLSLELDDHRNHFIKTCSLPDWATDLQPQS